MAPREGGKAVVFDESSRLDYVQGMRKRKNERRSKALAQMKQKMKSERRSFDRKKREIQRRDVAELNRIEAESKMVPKSVSKAVDVPFPVIPG